MNRKKLLLIIMTIILIMFSGCSSQETNISNEQYKVVEKENKYKGVIKSKNIDTYDYKNQEGYQLVVSNGETVNKDDILFDVDNTKIKSEVDSINKKIDTLNKNIESTQQQIDFINNKEYIKSDLLASQYKELQDAVTDMQMNINSQQLAMDSCKINLEYNINKQNDIINQNTDKISELENNLNIINSDIDNKKQEMSTENSDSDIDAKLNNNNILQEYEIKKNDIIAEINQLNQAKSEAQDEIEYLNVSYQNEMDTQNIQMDEFLKSNEKLKKQIDDFSNSTYVHDAMKQLTTQLESDNDTLTDYQKKCNDLNNGCIRCKNGGLAVIENDILYIYSDKYEFSYTASQVYFERLSEINPAVLKLSYNNSIISDIRYDYYVPDSENGMVEMIYEISSDDADINYVHGNYAYLIETCGIYVPEDYIIGEDDEFYVMKDNKKEKIEAEKDGDEYKVLSGLNVGDMLDKVK